MANTPKRTPVEKEIRKAIQSGNYAVDTTKDELRKMNPGMVQWRLDRMGIENLSQEAQKNIRGDKVKPQKRTKDMGQVPLSPNRRAQTSPQKIINRHQVRAHAESIDYRNKRITTNDKDIKVLQRNLNKYLGPDGVNAYDSKDSLKVDGEYGDKTEFRLERFRDLDKHITQDSVFNKIKNQREQWEINRSKYWKGEK